MDLNTYILLMSINAASQTSGPSNMTGTEAAWFIGGTVVFALLCILAMEWEMRRYLK